MKKQNISFQFKVLCKDTLEGDELYLAGSTKDLGEWNSTNAVKFLTNSTDFPLWSSKDISFELDPKIFFENLKNVENNQTLFEYKYYIKNRGKLIWEKFPGNRILTTNMILESMNLKENFPDNCDLSINFTINGEIFNDFHAKPIIKYQMYRGDEHEISSSDLPQIQPEVFIDKNGESIEKPDAQICINTESSNKENNINKENFEQEKQSENDLDQYLSELTHTIEEIKEKNFKLKDKLNCLFKTINCKTNIDKELLVLIFLHFYKSGQLKTPDPISTVEHNHHHDSNLAKSLLTYLLSFKNNDNAILINSILSYIPTCLDYRVVESGQTNYN